MLNPPKNLLSYLRVMVAAWREDMRDDAELLARFAEVRDEVAFTTLVGRHGQLVWRTCHRILGDTPDAEDAFQSTFLTLARKAGRFPVASLAGWLHRVARQAALNIDAGARRRRGLKEQLTTVKQPEEEEGSANRAELYAALDEELVDLPERLRVPLLLHYMEGRSQVEVARLLGCARSALQKRLTQGEAILRERLARRGLAVGIGTVTALLTSSVTGSAVSARLIGSTARAAVAFRSGALTGGAAEAARAVLGALPASIGTTIMRKSLWIVLACICSLGIGLAAWQVSSARSDAVESFESVASPKAAAEPGRGQVDRSGDPLPSGALARLGTLRFRHAGSYMNRKWAESVVFTPNSKVLITAGFANPIRVWEATTGKLLRSFCDSRENPAMSIALSPDGRTLAALQLRGGAFWGNCTGSLWEVATGKLLYQLEALVKVGNGMGVGNAIIHTLSFSRDGRTLLSAGSDNHLRVWEAATGKVLRDQPLRNVEQAGQLASLFSPDGKIFALISNHSSAVVHLWETATGKKLRHLSLSKGEIPQRGIAFSPDGRFLAVSSNWYDGAVHLWEVSTGKEVRKWTPDKAGTYSVAFSPDCKILATGSLFGPIRLWEAATGRELRRCQGYRAHVVALAFSPDGSTLVSLAGGHDYTVRLWEVASGKELVRASRGHVGPVLSVAFSADGKSVISGGRDGLVGLWNPETGQERCPPLRAGDFQALAVPSPDGKTFLTIGNSYSPNVYQNPQDQCEVALKTPSLVCVWDRATGQKLREFKGPEGLLNPWRSPPTGKSCS